LLAQSVTPHCPPLHVEVWQTVPPGQSEGVPHVPVATHACAALSQRLKAPQVSAFLQLSAEPDPLCVHESAVHPRPSSQSVAVQQVPQVPSAQRFCPDGQRACWQTPPLHVSLVFAS
jgi:hypothetical protein